MARGPRFWALGVESGPRGGGFEGLLDLQHTNTFRFIDAQTAPTVLRSVSGRLSGPGAFPFRPQDGPGGGKA